MHLGKFNLSSFVKLLAGGLLTVGLFAGIGVTANASDSVDGVTEYTGNPTMKAYGESIENGKTPQVEASDTPKANGGTTYYVDSVKGNDKNAGTSENTPWQTLKRVNEVTYKPGDRILLKAGSKWSATTLSPKGSGTSDQPIVISSYGSGDMPIIAGEAKVNDAVYLYNQQHIDISNLNVSNKAAGFTGKNSTANEKLLGDYRGIHVVGQDAGQLSGYVLHNLYVHDVTGLLAGVSGSGWDPSKRTGGIMFEIAQPKTSMPTTFNDITIRNNVLNNNSFGGIIIKQWKGDKTGTNENWASRDGAKAPNYTLSTWHPHTNVTIKDNYLSQASSDYAADTIYLTSTKDAVIEGNVSKKAGMSGIELYYTDNVVVQNNEVYEAMVKHSADSNGIDPDKETTNALIQYNYIHDTGDGILLCGLVFGSAVIRYNVVQNASKNYVNPHGTKGRNLLFNNVFYNAKPTSSLAFVKSSGGSSLTNNASNQHDFYNNLFYNTASQTGSTTFAEGKGTNYDANAYYGTGVTAPSQDKHAIVKDPLLTGTLTAEPTIENLKQLIPQSVSPLRQGGRKITADDYLNVSSPISKTDFFGNAFDDDVRNVGIYQ